MTTSKQYLQYIVDNYCNVHTDTIIDNMRQHNITVVYGDMQKSIQNIRNFLNK